MGEIEAATHGVKIVASGVLEERIKVEVLQGSVIAETKSKVEGGLVMLVPFGEAGVIEDLHRRSCRLGCQKEACPAVVVEAAAVALAEADRSAG